jgi:hypothetical protein
VHPTARIGNRVILEPGAVIGREATIRRVDAAAPLIQDLPKEIAGHAGKQRRRVTATRWGVLSIVGAVEGHFSPVPAIYSIACVACAIARMMRCVVHCAAAGPDFLNQGIVARHAINELCPIEIVTDTLGIRPSIR